MVTLIVSTALILAPMQGTPSAIAKSPLLGSVKRAPATTEAGKNAQLQNASGSAKAIPWAPYITMSPGNAASMGGRLVFFRPSCVDAGGIADLLGMPGGWNSKPGDQQSYLRTTFPVMAGKRYGMVFEISRYTDDVQDATFTFEGTGGNKTKNLNGPGNLFYSFVATQSGQGGVMLKMASKGRYLFTKVEIKVSNL